MSDYCNKCGLIHKSGDWFDCDIVPDETLDMYRQMQKYGRLKITGEKIAMIGIIISITIILLIIKFKGV